MRRDSYRLEKEIHNQRVELENAITGDKQRLRNTLSEHKALQLAYQNLPPTVCFIIYIFILNSRICFHT